MRSHLLLHLWIYVPIRLKCKHETTYTHHMRLHMTIGEDTGRHQNYFCSFVKLQIEVTDSRPGGPPGTAWMGFSSIREIPVVGWYLNTSHYLLHTSTTLEISRLHLTKGGENNSDIFQWAWIILTVLKNCFCLCNLIILGDVK